MNRHVLLDNVTHKDLRVIRDYAKVPGYDVNVARVFPSEFIQLQTEYPLFFIRNREEGGFEPVALLGFGDRENLFLDDNGWDAGYVPLSIERQPFLVGFQEQVVDGVPTEAPVVHIDLDHPAVSDTEGERVFLPHGGESPLLERISSILMTIHQGHAAAKSLSGMLVGLELIESLTLGVELKDGSKESLKGLYTINEDKLQALNASALEALHSKGHLRDVYMMLASLPNVSRLIDRKNRRLPD
jgi:hypothetical protein